MKNVYSFRFYVDGIVTEHNETCTNLKQARVIAKTLSSLKRKDIWVFKNQLFFGSVEYPSYLRNIHLTPSDLVFNVV